MQESCAVATPRHLKNWSCSMCGCCFVLVFKDFWFYFFQFLILLPNSNNWINYWLNLSLCLLTSLLRSLMTVSRGLRLGGAPPLEWSAALVRTLWFFCLPLLLPPSHPVPPLPLPLPPLPPLPRAAVLDVMSIVIALGVTTPETSYSDMAAGSE